MVAPAATGTTSAELHDAEDMLELQERRYWQSMLESGHTVAEVKVMRRLARYREEVGMYTAMQKYGGGEEEGFTAADVCIRLALAHKGLGNVESAVETLRRGWAREPDNVRIALVLAKILYMKGLSVEAVEVCRAVTELGMDNQSSSDGALAKDLGDAWYIRGWGELQNGDHSEAYRVWARGKEVVPNDSRLVRQCGKRLCWDVALKDDLKDSAQRGLLGSGAEVGGNSSTSAEAFSVPEGVPERALALFDRSSQDRQVVFRSREGLLSPGECSKVVSLCEAHAAKRGGWGTVRHSSVKTTDVAVEDIPELRPWLRSLMATRLAPFLAACYPRLADGSDLGPRGERVRIHDAFIVRYDAEKDESYSLPAHSDISTLSFSFALNDGAEDFGGGGTWFKALGGRVIDASVGHAVAFAGPLRHAGHPVRRGTRFILVLFLYVEGFRYGELLAAAGPCNDQTDSLVLEHPDPGGHVVYKETRELVEALDSAATDEGSDDDFPWTN
eukprot:TRINITY_DN50451_c0_g1_i1.p1 TRINITY_DN50451_c0_g1~~TRINITY_DN50451_c0_g1_i1.p1  ORF type:complete len:501 (+),score=73.41 TRINITY_DN50451_c0_g1_i1:64-1566(+)